MNKDTMSHALTAQVFGLSLGPVDKLVALAIADYAEPDGSGIHLDMDAVAKLCCVSKHAVHKTVERLVDAGVLVVVAPASEDKPTEHRMSFENVKDDKLRPLDKNAKENEPTKEQQVIHVWNEIVTPPIPKAGVLVDRLRKIALRLKQIPDVHSWRRIFHYVNRQDWCRAPGRSNPDYRGEHPGWIITLDWLIANDTRPARMLERIEGEAKAPPPKLTKRSIAAMNRQGGTASTDNRPPPYTPPMVNDD